MSDEELEEYINKIEPNFNSHLEKGTIEMSNEYYNLLEEKMVRLINKNQELKKQLEEYKRLGFKHLNDKCNKLEKENKILRENAEHNDKVVDKTNWENQKLKKQLEEANEKILLLQVSEPMLEYKKALEENQQKKFIEYLENEKNIYPYDISDYTYEDIINTILSKYEEIIEK